MNKHIQELVSRSVNKVVENRRYLHPHPELPLQEEKTARWIRDALIKAGIPMLEGISGNSTVGYLKGERPGPSIGLRADIDALGLVEENKLPYKSITPGVMHGCGHDAHTAVLLAVAEILAAHRELIKGTVYFVFEQAEEFLPGGAVQLVKDGIMDKIDYMFAIHVDAENPVGTIDIEEGSRFAAVGTYDFKITGKGGHGGFPHTANNPLLPISHLISSLNLIPALKCDPLANCTITVSYLHCGIDGVANVIPEKAVMGGCVRALDTHLRDFMMSEVERLGRAVCAAYNCDIEVSTVYGYPAVVNNGNCVALMADAADDLGITRLHVPPRLGAEDFSYFAEKKPSAIAWFGLADPSGTHEPTPHHSPKFYLSDEDGLPLALMYMLTVYCKACERFH